MSESDTDEWIHELCSSHLEPSVANHQKRRKISEAIDRRAQPVQTDPESATSTSQAPAARQQVEINLDRSVPKAQALAARPRQQIQTDRLVWSLEEREWKHIIKDLSEREFRLLLMPEGVRVRVRVRVRLV